MIKYFIVIGVVVAGICILDEVLFEKPNQLDQMVERARVNAQKERERKATNDAGHM